MIEESLGADTWDVLSKEDTGAMNADVPHELHPIEVAYSLLSLGRDLIYRSDNCTKGKNTNITRELRSAVSVGRQH